LPQGLQLVGGRGAEWIYQAWLSLSRCFLLTEAQVQSLESLVEQNVPKPPVLAVVWNALMIYLGTSLNFLEFLGLLLV